MGHKSCDRRCEEVGRGEQAEHEKGAAPQIEEVTRLHQYAGLGRQRRRPGLVGAAGGHAEDRRPPALGGEQRATGRGRQRGEQTGAVFSHAGRDRSPHLGAQRQQIPERCLDGGGDRKVRVGDELQRGDRSRGITTSGDDPAELQLWQPAGLGQTSQAEDGSAVVERRVGGGGDDAGRVGANG